MNSSDIRLIQQASISSIQRLALAVFGIVAMAVAVAQQILVDNQLTAAQVDSMLLILSFVSALFLATSIWGVMRKLRIARAIRMPGSISRVEQHGDRITIRRSDGRAIEFAVKRVPYPVVFGSSTPSDVFAALSRIAPHAVALRPK